MDNSALTLSQSAQILAVTVAFVVSGYITGKWRSILVMFATVAVGTAWCLIRSKWIPGTAATLTVLYLIGLGFGLYRKQIGAFFSNWHQWEETNPRKAATITAFGWLALVAVFLI